MLFRSENKNFDILQVYSFDESAYTNKRSEFDQIINLILNQHEKVAVCCDKVDRLSRNVFDKRISMLYERALLDQIELHFVSDGQIINGNISAVAKFQFSISLGLAKYYSDAISDNVKRAMEQKLRKGEWPSKAPFGYKNITRPDGKKDIVIDEYNSRIVEKAFELYSTGGFSMSLLCEKLNKDHGLKWRKSFLSKILNDSFYYGVMVCKCRMYPHRYPPIITKSLFDQVEQIIDGFKKKRFKYAGKPFAYRGLMRCAHCDMSITPESHDGYIYYHCTESNGKHGAKWVREEVVTEQLGAVFKKLQLPAEIVQQITETLNEVHQNKIEFHNKEIDKLASEQKSLATMIDNLYLDRLEIKISERDYDRFYQSMRDQITDIAIRVEQLQEAEDVYHFTATFVLEIIKRAHELFVNSEIEEKRQLIKLILSNLRIDGVNLLWDVQKPFDLFLNVSECLQ